MSSIAKIRQLLEARHVLKIAVIVGILILIVLIFKGVYPLYQKGKEVKITPNSIFSLIKNDGTVLRSTAGRTNILILGVGGGIHEGPDLTDSMIFVSLDATKKDAVMISLPRDIWSPTLQDKINTAYTYGEQKKKGGGLILAKSIVEEVLGAPIHYGWLIDFSNFTTIIDLLGGVDVDVETAFDDYTYPISGRENDLCNGDKDFACRYEHLHIDKGLQHMNGTLALKYVRSRNAQGDEGTDFARGKRQQKVILALKNRALQNLNIFAIDKNKQLLASLDKATDTDMKAGEILSFGRLFLSIKQDEIRKPVIDEGDEDKDTKGFLINPPLWQFSGKWVLTPRKGELDFSEIHEYVACYLENPKCSVTP